MSAPLSVTAHAALGQYEKLIRRRVFLLAILLLLLCASVLVDMATGPAGLGIDAVIRGVLAPADLGPQLRAIIWEIRLPQALLAVLVGGALALAGTEMQTVLNNALASPFTLGVSAAASFGAALAIILGIGLPGLGQSLVISGNAFLFAFASIMALMAISQLRGAGPEVVILFGIGIAFTFNALVAILQFAASQETLQQLVFWTLGSLTRANWQKLGILGVIVLLVLPWSCHSAWHLTALRLGEERARSLGLNIGRLRLMALLRVSLLASVAVAFAGTIGFVGLIGPHIARLLIGEDHRFLLPASFIVGALTLSLASIASKMVLPGVVLPIGIVTALIGLPVFFWLVFNRRERA